MAKIINCVKLKKDAEALSEPPFAGELGQRILDEVSDEAWKMWLSQQTILINEYRLSSLDPQARHFLRGEMKKFLFDDGDVDMPDEFKAL